MNRRKFIKNVGLTVGAASLTGGVSMQANRSVQVEEKAQPGLDRLLVGVSDIHLHGSPDTAPRSIDELELARQAKQAGYRAVMYKSNDWSSHDRAYLIRQLVPDFEVFGGICMNFVHGDKVNVYAAEQALKTTGNFCRCIWMPTGAATYPRSKNKIASQGIPVLDSQNGVLPEVTRVMEICAEADIIFASGHSSPRESLIMAKKAKEIGVKKFVVTHVNLTIWKLTTDQIKQVVNLGAYVEYCYLPRLWAQGSESPDMPRQSREEFLDYVRIAPERSFISTDLGQIGNPNPIDGMRMCIGELINAGIPQKDIDSLVRRNPAKLLGLDEH